MTKVSKRSHVTPDTNNTTPVSLQSTQVTQLTQTTLVVIVRTGEDADVGLGPLRASSSFRVHSYPLRSPSNPFSPHRVIVGAGGEWMRGGDPCGHPEPYLCPSYLVKPLSYYNRHN